MSTKYIMHRVLKTTLYIIITLTVGFSAQVAQASDHILSAYVDTNGSAQPELVMTNNSSSACQFARTAIGTTAVTRVSNNDQPIEPQVIDRAEDDSLLGFMQSQLAVLEPGQTERIPLKLTKIGDTTLLESVVWSENTGVHTLVYPVESPQDLVIDLTYSVPLEGSLDGPVLCPAITATTNNDITSGSSWVIDGLKFVFAIGVGVVAFVIVWRWKTGRRVAVIAALIISGIGWRPAPVEAGFSVDSSIQSQFDACLATLEANNDITGEVLTTLDMADITIRPSTDGRSDTVDYRRFDGGIIIYWDPTNTHDYAGTGGTSDPCTTLYHEMLHAHEMMWGFHDLSPCGDSGIRTSEVHATREQNRLRARLGLPERSHYGSRPLPEGDCTPPSEPEPCEGDGCGESNGDPHMRTFDGLRYDFQAVGEFILAKSKTDDFEIQTRQVAWGNSRYVAVTQSVVANVDGTIIEIAIRDNKTHILVDGEAQSTKTGSPLGDKINVSSRSIQTAWADGSRMIARPIGGFGIHVIVDPANERKDMLGGLLGNFNANSDDDLQVQNKDTVIKPEFDQLYPAFADSWRINDDTSMFVYEAGQTTDTFTDLSFPDEPPVLESLPGYDAARALCIQYGISNPEVLDNCILDVAITGRVEFAQAAVEGQHITKFADYGAQTWRLNIDQPEEIAEVTFTAEAGDKVFVDAFDTDLPDQCGILTLRDPDGRLRGNGCILKGRGHIDGVLLEVSGTYTLRVDPSGDRTGGVALRLIPIRDSYAETTLDADPTHASIERPGEVARIMFSGKAGQRVLIEASNVTLPDQCGAITLRSPSQSLAAGCFSRGQGLIDTQTLPEDGIYTVRIDPGQYGIGSLDLRIILTSDQEYPIVIDGNSQTIDLDIPGSRARFTFEAAANDRVFIELPEATIADQCGVLVLRDPDLRLVESGCILGGQGGLSEKGVTLDVSGKYLLTLDPAGLDVGSAKVTLYR